MATEDKKIRQKLKQKDVDLSKQLQTQMKKQQQMLKDYFKEYKKPVKQDPTVVKKRKTAQIQDKMNLYKQALTSVNLFRAYYEGFWNLQLHTPEQKNALQLAKDKVKSNIFKSVLGCLAITSLTSYSKRMYLRWPGHMFGAITGLGTGIILGIALSTQSTFQQLQKLGQNYELGRKAIGDIEKNRMDKK